MGGPAKRIRPLWKRSTTIGGSHFEKFLFYRGLGNFELPIKLAALGNDRFEVANSADDASGALLLVRIEDGRVRFMRAGTDSARTRRSRSSCRRRIDGRRACRGNGRAS